MAKPTIYQRFLSGIKNFYRPDTKQAIFPVQVSDPNKKAPAFRIAPFQFDRIRVNIQTWRDALSEAERAILPFRVKMMQIYQDTSLNEHVEACINRRKNLTLLRKFKICDDVGNENEEVEKIFKASWFQHFQSYSLDGKLYGYNLISLGDVVNDNFPNLSFVRRQNISPDRLTVSNFPYISTGTSFLEAPYSDWYIYVKTPTETGVSPCGYGLLYRVAKTEIFLRDNLSNNATYNEVFAQPTRVASTTKQDEERTEFEDFLATQGSNAYIILDKDMDELALLESKNAGTGHATYTDFEKRLEQKVSKILLGHADVLESIPGKLGSGQGQESPVDQALDDIQSEDGSFLESIVNNELIPRMKKLGFNIPDGLHFEYENDEEAEKFRAREDESNLKTATLFKMIADAGGDPDWKYFSDRTGIDVEKKQPPPPPVNPLQPIADPTKKNGQPKEDEIITE